MGLSIGSYLFIGVVFYGEDYSLNTEFEKDIDGYPHNVVEFLETLEDDNINIQVSGHCDYPNYFLSYGDSLHSVEWEVSKISEFPSYEEVAEKTRYLTDLLDKHSIEYAESGLLLTSYFSV